MRGNGCCTETENWTIRSPFQHKHHPEPDLASAYTQILASPCFEERPNNDQLLDLLSTSHTQTIPVGRDLNGV